MKTAHKEYVERQLFNVYEYDPTDDGPEVEVIVSIRINHTEADLEDEFSESCWHSIDAAMDAWQVEIEQDDLELGFPL